MKFGYARVSTEEQSLDRQIDALNSYGVDELLTEKMTGTKRNRPELDRLLDKLRNGDLRWWSILKNRGLCLSV